MARFQDDYPDPITAEDFTVDTRNRTISNVGELDRFTALGDFLVGETPASGEDVTAGAIVVPDGSGMRILSANEATKLHSYQPYERRVLVQPVAPTTPETGQVWLNTITSVLSRWDSMSWVPVVLRRWNGTAWEAITPTIDSVMSVAVMRVNPTESAHTSTGTFGGDIADRSVPSGSLLAAMLAYQIEAPSAAEYTINIQSGGAAIPGTVTLNRDTATDSTATWWTSEARFYDILLPTSWLPTIEAGFAATPTHYTLVWANDDDTATMRVAAATMRGVYG